MKAAHLAGKRVLVTGGAGAVGRSVAARFIGLGARVLIADRDEADLRRATEEIALPAQAGLLEAVAADLSSSSGLAHVFARVDAGLGGLDLLVACAGVGAGPLMTMAEAEWRAVFDNNLVSHVAAAQCAVERMRAAGDRQGMIILVGSASVHRAAAGDSVLNASKGGVALFAETLRRELIADGIRVTLIEPGATASALQPLPPEERARQVEEQRMLDPDQVADAILFAATRPPGVDVVSLRIEPLAQRPS